MEAMNLFGLEPEQKTKRIRIRSIRAVFKSEVVREDAPAWVTKSCNSPENTFELFRDLDKLNPGDEIIVYTSQRAYVYVVNQSQVVEPTRVDLMAQTQEPVVTLISCYPYMVDNQRIVVTAILEDMR